MNRLLLACSFAAGSLAAAPLPSVEVAAEALRTPGITLTQTTGTFRFKSLHSDTSLTLGAGTVALDYAPASFDFLGRPLRRRETSTSAQAAWRLRTSDRFELLAGAGLRSGHDNHRSVWLDEYFRQRFTPFAGYRDASPRGHAFSGGLRWEYIAGAGFAQLGYSRTQDDVAPGYEFDFDGLRRGAETLVTDAAAFALENVLTPRLRTRLELRAAGTSGRKPRWGIEASARHAIGERWIVRTEAGGSLERPDFRARHAGLELEFSATETVALFAGAHAYVDRGEIENALLFTSAAPAVRSRRIEIGVRHDGDRRAWLLALGTITSDFAATNPATDFFQNLYRDRSWRSVRLAASWKF